MLIHAAEIAIAMFLAYMVGWLVGYLAHRLVAPSRHVANTGAALQDAVPPEDVGQPAVTADAAEGRRAAPISDDVRPGPELGSVEAEAAEAMAAAGASKAMPLEGTMAPEVAAAPEVEPVAVEAALAASMLGAESVARPAEAIADAPLSDEIASTAEVEPVAGLQAADAGIVLESAAGLLESDSSPVSTAASAPATRPGVPWTGEIRGFPATKFEAATLADAPRPASESPAEPVSPPAAPVEIEGEDAAMRAIEGGWSRRSARAPSDAPQLGDLGSAVAAAQTAVEKALKQLEPEPRPPEPKPADE